MKLRVAVAVLGKLFAALFANNLPVSGAACGVVASVASSEAGKIAKRNALNIYGDLHFNFPPSEVRIVPPRQETKSEALR